MPTACPRSGNFPRRGMRYAAAGLSDGCPPRRLGLPTGGCSGAPAPHPGGYSPDRGEYLPALAGDFPASGPGPSKGVIPLHSPPFRSTVPGRLSFEYTLDVAGRMISDRVA